MFYKVDSLYYYHFASVLFQGELILLFTEIKFLGIFPHKLNFYPYLD